MGWFNGTRPNCDTFDSSVRPSHGMLNGGSTKHVQRWEEVELLNEAQQYAVQQKDVLDVARQNRVTRLHLVGRLNPL